MKLLLYCTKAKPYLYANINALEEPSKLSDKDVLSPFCAIDIMIKIIRTSEEKIMYIIDVAEKYAKKTHTKIFDKLVDNLSERNKESKLKNYSLWFINMIMNYCHPSKLPRILIQLRDVGIFEILENRKHTDKNFETQVNMFLEKTQSVLLDSDYEVEIYKKEIEDLKTHCYEIEIRNSSFSEENEFYEILVDEFIKYLDFSDCFVTQAGITNDKTKERKDNKLDVKITVDERGAVDFQKLIEEKNNKDFKVLLDR